MNDNILLKNVADMMVKNTDQFKYEKNFTSVYGVDGKYFGVVLHSIKLEIGGKKSDNDQKIEHYFKTIDEADAFCLEMMSKVLAKQMDDFMGKPQ